jgi:hypothetical protein
VDSNLSAQLMETVEKLTTPIHIQTQKTNLFTTKMQKELKFMEQPLAKLKAIKPATPKRILQLQQL